MTSQAWRAERPHRTARQLQQVAAALGFEDVGRRAATNDGRTVTADPSHPTAWWADLGPPLFFKILRQLNVSQDEFNRLR